MERFKNWCLTIVIVVAVAGLSFSALRLMDSHNQYRKGEDTYQEIADDFVKKEPKETPEVDAKKNDGASQGYQFLQIDFKGLKALNPEVIAWIDIPGAKISYPVLQGGDNSYYLSHLSDGTEGIHGSIFMDYHNQPDFSDRNTILYGHNMKDGTMFAALDAYAQESVCREYPFFYIYTPEHAIVYEIYACYTGWVESAAYSYQFPAEETFLEFLQETSRSSLYDAKGIPDDSSRIVTLSTCTNISRQQRFIIHGMRRESK